MKYQIDTQELDLPIGDVWWIVQLNEHRYTRPSGCWPLSVTKDENLEMQCSRSGQKPKGTSLKADSKVRIANNVFLFAKIVRGKNISIF